MSRKDRDRTDLIHIAAGLARGIYLPAIDPSPLTWYRTTPVAERARIMKAMEEAHEFHKELATILKRIADSRSEGQS